MYMHIVKLIKIFYAQGDSDAKTCTCIYVTIYNSIIINLKIYSKNGDNK